MSSSTGSPSSRRASPGSHTSPISRRIRPTSCRNRSMRSTIPPRDRHSGAGPARAERASPSARRLLARHVAESDTLHHRRRQRSATGRDADFRVIRAIYWGMISEVDAADRPGARRARCGRRRRRHRHRAHLGSCRDARRPLGARQVRLFRSVLSRAAGHRRSAPGEARRIDAFTELVDLMPTIIELAGGRPPRHISTAARSSPSSTEERRGPGVTRSIGNTIFAKSRRAPRRIFSASISTPARSP